MEMLQILSMFILVMALLPTPILSSEICDFRAIFNFGDSNSDTGGLSAMFGQPPPPNGETFFHSPAGRYCDGRLLIDFIAEGLGLPYLSAYLDSVGSNFSHGANYATAGSTIRRQNTSYFQSWYSPISLDVQAIEFSNFHTRSQTLRRRGGVFSRLMPEERDFSSALYTFDIGQNDLTAGYKLNMTTEQVKAYVPDVISQFSNVVKYVYAQGGRSFWIHNTAPLGCLPYMMDQPLTETTRFDKFGCINTFNEVSRFFNRWLKDAITELRNDLPLAAITYVDIYSVKYSLISHAKKLGFDDPFLACRGSCKDPSTRISWDRIHFTEAANKWIYDRIVDGSFSDPPVPLKSACRRKDNS